MILGKTQMFTGLVKRSGELLNPLKLGVRMFRPKIRFTIEKGKFTIKTVETGFELESVLRLRYDVFIREMLHKTLMFGIDMDKFDFICDHIVIIDNKTDRYIGTYRVNCSAFSKLFYSDTEFDISAITRLPGVKLELGRACVHREYRNGVTLALLWHGINEYCAQTGARYLFGCSSIKTTEFLEICMLYRHLRERFMAPPDMHVTPRRKFRISYLDLFLNQLESYNYDFESFGAERLIPPLVSSYLKSGAVICGEPALDKAFACTDFLTVLDLDAMSQRMSRKYTRPNPLRDGATDL